MRRYSVRVMSGLVMAQRAVEAAGRGTGRSRFWRRMGKRAAKMALSTGGCIAYMRARVFQPVKIRASLPVSRMRGMAAIGAGMTVYATDTYT